MPSACLPDITAETLDDVVERLRLAGLRPARRLLLAAAAWLDPGCRMVIATSPCEVGQCTEPVTTLGTCWLTGDVVLPSPSNAARWPGA